MKDIFKEVSVKAVAIGFLIDILATMALLYGVAILADVIHLNNATIYRSITFSLSLVCSVLGGYAAVMIKRNISNGIWVGILGVLLGLIFLVTSQDYKASLMLNILGLILTIPSTYLGGILAVRMGGKIGAKDSNPSTWKL